MISIVVPVYDEEEVVPELLRRLLEAGKSWGVYEVIFVDDGSHDKTAALLTEALAANPRLRLISFSRNFGHQVAVTAGLEHARGDAVVVIDGDLQDPPEVIERFVQKWNEGYKVVYAVREGRKENVFKRAAYALFYRVLRMMVRIDIPLDAGDFCLMDKKVVNVMNAMPERNRFIRGLRSWVGFRSIGVPYERSARTRGSSKYSLRMLFHLAFDGITGFTTVPLKFSIYIGFMTAALSFLAGILLLILKFTVGVEVTGWTSIVLAIFFMSGVQLCILGVMGEYLGRIYTEVQHRPVYVIKDALGFDK
jgi:dolichol-phosphate mannosyltransferase